MKVASNALAISESEVIRKGLLAFIEKEIRLAEWEIAQIRERYDVFSGESLYQAIWMERSLGTRRRKIASSGRIERPTSHLGASPMKSPIGGTRNRPE